MESTKEIEKSALSVMIWKEIEHLSDSDAKALLHALSDFAIYGKTNQQLSEDAAVLFMGLVSMLQKG